MRLYIVKGSTSFPYCFHEFRCITSLLCCISIFIYDISKNGNWAKEINIICNILRWMKKGMLCGPWQFYCLGQVMKTCLDYSSGWVTLKCHYCTKHWKAEANMHDDNTYNDNYLGSNFFCRVGWFCQWSPPWRVSQHAGILWNCIIDINLPDHHYPSI